jgi:hypothetical protein
VSGVDSRCRRIPGSTAGRETPGTTSGRALASPRAPEGDSTSVHDFGGELMAVPMKPGKDPRTLIAGAPVPLFAIHLAAGGNLPLQLRRSVFDYGNPHLPTNPDPHASVRCPAVIGFNRFHLSIFTIGAREQEVPSRCESRRHSHLRRTF